MAMEIVKVIDTQREVPTSCMSYNKLRREVFSATEGERSVKVWDLKTGQLLRRLEGHYGAVTALVYANTIKLLFSASVDGNICIWTDTGAKLQMLTVGQSVFSLCWNSKRKLLLAGCNSALLIYKVDMADLVKLRQEQRARERDLNANSSSNNNAAAAATNSQTSPKLEVLRPVVPPLKGPALCHIDIVKAIVVTDMGRVFTAGFDGALCLYDLNTVDKHPKEAFTRISRAHKAAITSLAYDPVNSAVLTGAADGGLALWSPEGRCVERVEKVSNRQVAVISVPNTATYWATGKNGKLIAVDPRAPAEITKYVAPQNALGRHTVDHLLAPHSTDLVLAATKGRHLVVWQYNKDGAHRVFTGHDDWVEGVMAIRRHKLSQSSSINSSSSAAQHCKVGQPEQQHGSPPRPASPQQEQEQQLQQHLQQALEYSGREVLYSWGADGKVMLWELDAEQNCDIYRAVEEVPLHSGTIHDMVYCPDLDMLVAGCDDGSIKLLRLSGESAQAANDAPLPNEVKEHKAKVTALCALGGTLVASASADRHLRIWDMASVKLLAGARWAHNTPLQCIAHAPELNQIATCGQGNKVKIWDVSYRGTHWRCCMVLNHADPTDHQDELQVRGKRDDDDAGSASGSSASSSRYNSPRLQHQHQQQQHRPGSLRSSNGNAAEQHDSKPGSRQQSRQQQEVAPDAEAMLHTTHRMHSAQAEQLQHEAVPPGSPDTSKAGNRLASAKAGASSSSLLQPDAAPAHRPGTGSSAPSSAGSRGRGSNMNWVTKSDMEAAKKTLTPLEEAIQDAAVDVPEVTQVRWVPWKRCWITAADDDLVRLWSPAGELLQGFRYQGGSCQHLAVDAVNKVVLLAAADSTVYAYNLEDPVIPLAKLRGHSEIVRGIASIGTQSAYMTASWDKTLRLWRWPVNASNDAAAAAAGGDCRSKQLREQDSAPNEMYLAGEDGEDGGDGKYVSEWEKQHPIRLPKILTQDNMKMIQAMNNAYDSDDDSPPTSPPLGQGRPVGRAARRAAAQHGKGRDRGNSQQSDDLEAPGSLAAKLTDLGRRLLAEIEGSGPSSAGSGGSGRSGAAGRLRAPQHAVKQAAKAGSRTGSPVAVAVPRGSKSLVQ